MPHTIEWGQCPGSSFKLSTLGETLSVGSVHFTQVRRSCTGKGNDMIATTKYSNVESLTYRFTPYEVQIALMKVHGIKDEGTVEFELGEDGQDPPYLTTITVKLSKEQR